MLSVKKEKVKSMKVKVMLDAGAKMPEKAHTADAGYDLFGRDFCIISPGSSAVLDTGVHVQIPDGYVGFLQSKSGLNVNHSITSEGVIDSGYTGSIRVKLYNNGKDMYQFFPGDKLSQIVFLKCEDFELVEADGLEETERGNNGFGSSGR